MGLSKSNLSSLAENEGLTIRTIDEEKARIPKGSKVKWHNDPDGKNSVVVSEPYHDVDGNVCVKVLGDNAGEQTNKYACFLTPVG